MTQNHLNTLEGLSTAQAATRLAEDGPNDITPVHRRSVASRLLDMLRQPMFALLLAAAVLYMTLGDLTEGLTLSVFVLAVLGLTFYQEGKSEASIQALRDLTQASAHVMRSGQKIQVPAREVVTGDLLVLSEGDRVAADGQLLSANNLQIDESLLTGESLPVNKSTNAQDNTVHAGSFVVRGQGLARVTATGQRSQIGRIGQSLNEPTSGTTPLQAQTARLVQRLAVIVLFLCIGMVLTLGLRSGQWIPAVLSGIALAMAILPEEYPVVLTIFPALGAHRLTREGVLTRRINAIETLGATTVLCTDKTGTLTQNRMTVTAMAVGPAHAPLMASLTSPAFALPEAFHPLLEHAILASAPEPFDPMEAAFHTSGQTHLVQTARLHGDNWRLVQSYALSPQLKAMSHVWQFDESLDRVVSAKGAPEAVMDLCHLSEADRQAWSHTIDSMAAQGLRVLAVAQSHYEGNDWPETAHAFAFEWLGLIGLTDPLRPEIPQAMAECRSAGIRVIMITGDYPATAQVIATQAGLPPGQTLTGDALDRLNDEALQALLPQVSVCARISPHQKLRIVQALQAHGEVVTMTGDGVNDAPALHAAHVGVAMGLRGTDVAREAADLVLVDDNFASIVRGIRVGRRIFGNLQKSMRYIFAIHIPIAGIALAPMVMAWPALMLPLHVALLEMVIDPACSIAFENEPADADVMQRPPRDTRAALFGMKDIAWALAQGLLVLACVGLTYAWAKGWIIGETPRAWLEEEIRAMVFVTLVLGYAALIVVNRAAPGHFLASLRVPNPSAWGVILLAWACVVLGMYWPWLAEALKFAPLQAPQWAVALSAGGLSLVAMVGLQWVWSQYPVRRT